MFSIGIGADIVPTKSNIEYFNDGNIETLLGKKLLNILKNCDYTIFNLEAPLCDLETPINKCGPNLRAPKSCIKGLSIINPHFFNLANNHIYDYGENGINSTIGLLKEKRIDFAGIGDNINNLKKSHIAVIKNVKIGIYCCAENEFSIATSQNAGANPFDSLQSFDDVYWLKKKVDFLVVLYHGGIEHYRYPSPNLQRVFRKFADVGADIVIGQHSHCIGCMEDYKNSKLIYGQGNFLFDGSESDLWQTSLFLKINFDDNGWDVEYVPLKKEKNYIRLANNEDKEKILKDFVSRSKQILNEAFIRDSFENLCMYKENSYIRALSGNKNIFEKIFIKIFKPKTNYFYNNTNLKICYDYILCESHNEIIKNILKRNLRNDV